MLAGMSDETEETVTVETENEVEIVTDPPPASEPNPEPVAEAAPEPIKKKPVRQAGTGHPRHNKGPRPRVEKN